jgi:hypothetical protein
VSEIGHLFFVSKKVGSAPKWEAVSLWDSVPEWELYMVICTYVNTNIDSYENMKMTTFSKFFAQGNYSYDAALGNYSYDAGFSFCSYSYDAGFYFWHYSYDAEVQKKRLQSIITMQPFAFIVTMQTIILTYLSRIYYLLPLYLSEVLTQEISPRTS